LLLKMARGGARFEAVASPYQGSYFGLIGRAGVLIVYGLRGNAFRSVDAGLSWTKVETGLPVGLTAATLLPDLRLALVSQAGHVLVSSDDGASFSLTRRPGPGPAAAAVPAGEDALVLGGLRGVGLFALDPK
jgi:photosystem II stability/assembly factor-like uncharacterized protein